MSCACPRSPKGLSPAAHLADGTTDLILFDMTFVEVHRVRRFLFTPRQDDSELDLRENGKQLFSQICHPAYSSWNCDGEILPHAAIEVGAKEQGPA
ncbi:hypothetical protein J4Q44_G00292780 [Coregonus suidteri]|uniref:Uncharacterized protein n=1 Tax=Coregonus suidteri TaxID=861788 RepID=A0AAN8L903_9TELE